jgi:hypothetical protein
MKTVTKWISIILGVLIVLIFFWSGQEGLGGGIILVGTLLTLVPIWLLSFYMYKRGPLKTDKNTIKDVIIILAVFVIFFLVLGHFNLRWPQ